MRTDSAQAPPGGQERAYGTVVFCDMAGSTRLGEELDAEDLARIVLAVKDHLYEAFEAMGGEIVQFQGDGVHVLFGYPDFDEGTPRRAILAALDAHARVECADITDVAGNPVRVRLHTGIHSGPFTVQEGLSTDGRYILIGDAVNVAAHLCGAAGAGRILASEATLGDVSAFFRTSQTRRFQLKGRRKSIFAAFVEGQSDVRTRSGARNAHGIAGLVGRDASLAALGAVQARAGTGRIVAAGLIGEAGAGKSHLASVFCDQAARGGATVATGTCESLGGCLPLQPVRHLLGRLLHLSDAALQDDATDKVAAALARLDPDLTAHAGLLAQVLGAGDAPSAKGPLDLEAVAGALGAVCRAHAAQAPLVLFVDDWQWSDDASRQILAGLLFAQETARIMLLLATREPDPDDAVLSAATAVTVGALEAGAARALVQSVLRDDAPETLIAQIVAQAGGNPLFLETLSSGVNAVLDDGGMPTVLPEASASVQGAIKGQLARLPDGDRQLLGAAAVLGISVRLDVLTRLSGHGDVEDLAERLVATGLVERAPGSDLVQFRHGLVRDAVYASIGLDRRRKLHLDAAEILDDPFADKGLRADPEALAHHFAAAGVPAEATRHAERAGDRAMAASSMDLARRQYAAALRALDALAETDRTRARFVDLCERWAIPCVYGPEPDQIETLMRAIRFAEAAGNTGAVARLNRWVGYLYYVLGLLSRSIGRFELALDGARDLGHAGLIAQIQANLGQAYGAAADYAPALENLDGAISQTVGYLARTRSNEVPVAAAYAAACRALVRADRGAFEAAEADIDIALHDFGGAGHMIEGSIRNMAGPMHLWRAQHQAAIDGALRSRQIAERAGARHVLAFAHAIEGAARAGQGDPTAGLTQLRRGVAMLERQRLHLYASFMYGWLAEAALDAEEPDEAAAFARKALLRVEEHDFFGEAAAHRVLARLAAAADGPAAVAVLASLDDADRAAARRSAPHEAAATALLRARLLDEAGQHDQSRTAARVAETAFAALGMDWHVDAARRLSGGGGCLA